MVETLINQKLFKAPIKLIKATKHNNGIIIPVVDNNGNWGNLFIPLGDVTSFVTQISKTAYAIGNTQPATKIGEQSHDSN